MKLLLSIAGLATLAMASPTSSPPPIPTRPIETGPYKVMAQLGFYQNSVCSHTGTYWYFTTRRAAYEDLLEQKGGCQNVHETMGLATAIRVESQDSNCSVTLYTNKDCDPASANIVTVPELVCTPAEGGRAWKSYTIRGC
ncbi:hypothetical protein QBC41DRAFT_325800 [Cercophora samala]|uniref:Uncharacterized protein n=1 Tax=Cercophora samala TaxID=330535 RepID=A0AA40DAI8_9PEZI|nr:hypothetical protein QBC41DRAFT_325800 [Cercophora samala]